MSIKSPGQRQFAVSDRRADADAIIGMDKLRGSGKSLFVVMAFITATWAAAILAGTPGSHPVGGGGAGSGMSGYASSRPPAAYESLLPGAATFFESLSSRFGSGPASDLTGDYALASFGTPDATPAIPAPGSGAPRDDEPDEPGPGSPPAPSPNPPGTGGGGGGSTGPPAPVTPPTPPTPASTLAAAREELEARAAAAREELEARAAAAREDMEARAAAAREEMRAAQDEMRARARAAQDDMRARARAAQDDMRARARGAWGR